MLTTACLVYKIDAFETGSKIELLGTYQVFKSILQHVSLGRVTEPIRVSVIFMVTVVKFCI